MKKINTLAAIVALALSLSSSFATAGPIERACLSSGRDGANRSTCGCIQRVADQTLRGNDQRKAAKFFRDPDLAHEIWLSKSRSDDAFWERYQTFGATAEAYCSG